MQCIIGKSNLLHFPVKTSYPQCQWLRFLNYMGKCNPTNGCILKFLVAGCCNNVVSPPYPMRWIFGKDVSRCGHITRFFAIYRVRPLLKLEYLINALLSSNENLGRSCSFGFNDLECHPFIWERSKNVDHKKSSVTKIKFQKLFCLL